MGLPHHSTVCPEFDDIHLTSSSSCSILKDYKFKLWKCMKFSSWGAMPCYTPVSGIFRHAHLIYKRFLEIQCHQNLSFRRFFHRLRCATKQRGKSWQRKPAASDRLLWNIEFDVILIQFSKEMAVFEDRLIGCRLIGWLTIMYIQFPQTNDNLYGNFGGAYPISKASSRRMRTLRTRWLGSWKLQLGSHPKLGWISIEIYIEIYTSSSPLDHTESSWITQKSKVPSCTIPAVQELSELSVTKLLSPRAIFNRSHAEVRAPDPAFTPYHWGFQKWGYPQIIIHLMLYYKPSIFYGYQDYMMCVWHNPFSQSII